MAIHVLDRSLRGERWISRAHPCLESQNRMSGYGFEARSSRAARVKYRPSGLCGQTHDGNSVGSALGTDLLPGGTNTQNLLQTGFYGRALGAIPVRTSLGADWTRYLVLLNRCEGLHRPIESAVLLFSILERRRFGLARRVGHKIEMRRRTRNSAPPAGRSGLLLGSLADRRSGRD